MKGITMEENKQQLAALKKLLDLPHNKQCADCVGGGGAARASWASINTGVFICMRCAGIHRGLGVHVSKVYLRSWGNFSACSVLVHADLSAFYQPSFLLAADHARC